MESSAAQATTNDLPQTSVCRLCGARCLGVGTPVPSRPSIRC